MNIPTQVQAKCDVLSKIKKDTLKTVVYEQIYTQEKDGGILKKGSRVTKLPVPPEYTRLTKVSVIHSLDVGLEWQDILQKYQFKNADLWEKAKLILGFEERVEAQHTYAARLDKFGIVRCHEKYPDRLYIRALQKKGSLWQSVMFDSNNVEITDKWKNIQEEYLDKVYPKDNPFPFDIYTLTLDKIKYVETSKGIVVVNEVSPDLQKKLLIV